MMGILSFGRARMVGVATVALLVPMVATAGVAHADPPDVAMNEIFYNAPSTDPAFAAVEFIEPEELRRH